MPAGEFLQIVLYVGAVVLLAKPLGEFMARIYHGERTLLTPVFGSAERAIYQLCGVDPTVESGWKQYAVSMILFNLIGFVTLLLILLFQNMLPLNSQEFKGLHFWLALNTAISFTTNTNWQSYGGETTMSTFSQMLGLGVHNFLSAATGMAVLVALIRGFARKTATTIGNFWVDLVRSILYILLPLSIVLTVVLIWQGVPQTFGKYETAQLVEPFQAGDSAVITEQTIALGLVASQVAIKQLGTNGGGYFNANSGHPLENPTPLSNFLEMLAILLISGGLCFTFGRMIGDQRQGWAIFLTMLLMLLGFLIVTVYHENAGNPALNKFGVDQKASAGQPGGNMEGKEVRFGPTNSAIWATATTAASNGSVNSMHDSFTPLGGLAPLILIQLGEVVFGGVGSGLYGMLIFAMVAVFIAGLMVGRTPEYLGKKIETYEMKMASLVLLAPIASVLIGTALACITPAAQSSVANPGAHGFSEILYAFSSAANNNGSAFAGLTADTNFYNPALGLAMLLGRYLPMIAVLAIAGSLVAKKSVVAGSGTLPTHGVLFIVTLIAVVLIVGALSFFPALALGPIVEHLML